MNALKARKQYDQKQRRLAYEKYREDEDAKLALMSPEEREIYLNEQEAKRRKVAAVLGAMATVSGPYGTDDNLKDLIKLLK